MARFPYVWSPKKACAPAVGTLIGWWWWWLRLRSLMAPRTVRFGVGSRKLSIVGQPLDGWPKIFNLELLRRKHIKPLVPAALLEPQLQTHWIRVGYGSFFLCVIHKESPCASSRDINDDECGWWWWWLFQVTCCLWDNNLSNTHKKVFVPVKPVMCSFCPLVFFTLWQGHKILFTKVLY
jgi:hypothetical protein